MARPDTSVARNGAMLRREFCERECGQPELLLDPSSVPGHPLVTRPTNQTKDHGKQNREDDRCHDREIDADVSVRALIFDVAWKKSRRDISFRTLVFDVVWKKRQSGRGVWYIGVCASFSCEPIDESESKQHDNENYKKRIHDTVVDFSTDQSKQTTACSTLT
jgi:hypothetical protein